MTPIAASNSFKDLDWFDACVFSHKHIASSLAEGFARLHDHLISQIQLPCNVRASEGSDKCCWITKIIVYFDTCFVIYVKELVSLQSNQKCH